MKIKGVNQSSDQNIAEMIYLFYSVRRSIHYDTETDKVRFTEDGSLVLAKQKLNSSQSRQFCLADIFEGEDVVHSDTNEHLAVLSCEPCKSKV